MRKRAIIFGLAALLAAPSAFAAQAEKRTTLQDQQGVAVTIYGEDLALVKDRRKVGLDAGENLLAFGEVSARIRPETAMLRNVSHPKGFTVLEQYFDFDLLTPEALLGRYVGRTVGVVKVHPQTGEETEVEARVLAVEGGIVLRIGDRIETGVPGRLVYPDVPENLRERPTLVADLVTPAAGAQELELSYLTGGLSWQADYVAELREGQGALDLSGWVTLTNQSGTSYPDARLQLVAGNVHRVKEEVMLRRDLARPEMAMAAPAMAPPEGLFEYHLYTLPRPVTLRENQTRQVALMSAANIPVRQENLLRGQEFYYHGRHGDLGRRQPVSVFLEFDNREKSGLGAPLPGGIVRVYQRDAAGGAQFIGEDRIAHTPRNETARLRLGEAFDITAERTQTDFRRLAGGERETVIESAYRIELRNGKKEEVTVKVAEPVPGDWEMVSQTHPHIKEDARTAVWQIKVPAEGKAVLEYRVRIRL